jgi:hypothetical protein
MFLVFFNPALVSTLRHDATKVSAIAKAKMEGENAEESVGFRGEWQQEVRKSSLAYF